MQLLFLDESGDHSLAAIDPEYPVFVLGGVLVDADYANRALEEEVARFKMDMFGRPDIVLHTMDIVRQRNGFEALKDADFRERFYGSLNNLMSRLEYRVIACAISKLDLRKRRGAKDRDPYSLSLRVVAEQMCFAVGDEPNGGAIIAESRDHALDRELELTWESLRLEGTNYLKAETIRERIVDFQIKSKKERISGLELADLVVSPIGRRVIGKPGRDDWRVVPRPTLAYVLPVVERAFRERGLPNAIRSDNGPPFASAGLGGFSAFAVHLVKLGVTPERIAPGHPSRTGASNASTGRSKRP